MFAGVWRYAAAVAAFAVLAFVIAGCAGHGNAHIDYRGDSFSTVNDCRHNTRMPCR